MVKDPKKVAQGKKAKAAGSDFELRVRKDMTEKGWVVDKFGNNVEITDVKEECIKQVNEGVEKAGFKICGEIKVEPGYIGKLIIAKNKWAGPGRPMMMGAGFPDFVCFRFNDTIFIEADGYEKGADHYDVIGVECKCDGYLSKLEREKCQWLLDNNVFSKILVASKHKIKNRIHIEYEDFEIKYGKKQNAK